MASSSSQHLRSFNRTVSETQTRHYKHVSWKKEQELHMPVTNAFQHFFLHQMLVEVQHFSHLS